MSSTFGIVRSRSRLQCDFLHLPQYKLSSPLSQRSCGVCYSDNNIKDLLISSRPNDFTNCKRRFNVDIYISAMDHARKSKLRSSVHLPSINKLLQYCYA